MENYFGLTHSKRLNFILINKEIICKKIAFLNNIVLFRNFLDAFRKSAFPLTQSDPNLKILFGFKSGQKYNFKRPLEKL